MPASTLADIPTSTRAPLGAGAPPAWHALCGDDALAHWGSDINGLSPAEAAQRLQQFDRNEIARTACESRWALFWRQINNPLIYVLIGASALAFATGKTLDGFVVLGVVVANALIGFFQELRAGQALEALSRLVPELCNVVRNSERHTLSAGEVVPGDIIAVSSGDKVPADARIIHAKGLRADEAALTGESVPAEKHTDPLPEDILRLRSSPLRARATWTPRSCARCGRGST